MTDIRCSIDPAPHHAHSIAVHAPGNVNGNPTVFRCPGYATHHLYDNRTDYQRSLEHGEGGTPTPLPPARPVTSAPRAKTDPAVQEAAVAAAVVEAGWDWEPEPGVPSPEEAMRGIVCAALAAAGLPGRQNEARRLRTALASVRSELAHAGHDGNALNRAFDVIDEALAPQP